MRHTYLSGIRAAVVAAVALAAVAACGSSGGSTRAPPASNSSSGGASSSGTAANGTPIKIGTIGNYTGLAADTSKATADDLQAWAKDVNAKGGIAGHPVQVIVEDDSANPAKSVVEVKDLIEKQHVIALVGNHESGVDAAWAKYADSQHVPVVGGVATGIAYSTDPNFFPIGNTGVNGSAAYLNATKLFGKTAMSTIYCAELPACAQITTLQNYYAPKFGIKSVQAQAVSASAPGYTAQCQKLKDDGADAIFTASGRDVAERFIAQCRSQGYSPLFIDNPQNWQDSATSNPVWDGAVLASDAPLWFGDGPGTAEYLAAVNKYAPGAIKNSSGTAGWYSGKLFEAALNAALKNGASGPITSQTVYDGLYALGPNFDLGGIVAPITYTKDKPAQQQLCAWYALVKDKKLTTPKGANRICTPNVQPPPVG